MIKKKLHELVKYVKSNPRLDFALLVVALSVFAVIAIANAPRASIWFDEAFSVYIAQFSFWDIARYTATDVHPPFYYWVLKVWSSLFGTTELAIRSLSIIFGAGAIATTFALVRKMFGRPSAAVSLILLSLSPMIIRFSDEARMYTLAAMIIMLATYVMVKASEAKSKKLWIVYGVLVSLGMWTHYFTALAWLAHWFWRATQVWKKGNSPKVFIQRLFSKEWITAYSVAIGLYLPWLPFMAFQLGVVQSGGFWIGPVTINSPANYFTNFFYYLEREQVHSWYALGVMVAVGLIIWLTPRAYKALSSKERKNFALIASLAWVPPVLLMLASMPPLKSSFVERYLVPAIIALVAYLGIILVVGTRKWKPLFRVLPVLLIVSMMIFGITNVFKYGNFNKNTNYHILTRQVVENIHLKAEPGQPIVSQSPWVFYEAHPYATDSHPVYFLEENSRDDIGSLAMLQDRDQYKIKDLERFTNDNPIVWYIGQSKESALNPPRGNWTRLQDIEVKDEITGNTIYRASQFKVEYAQLPAY